MRVTVSLHGFLQEFQRSSLVPRLGDVRFNDFAFVVDSAPEVVALASNFDEDFVQMPPPLRAAPHGFRAPLPDLVSEIGAEPVHPKPDTLVANVDATFVEKVFDITE